MVKFQKQLARQLVPEWKDGYCDYKQLKRDVKRIKGQHQLVSVKMSVEKISKNAVYPLKSIGMPLVALSDRLANNLLFIWDKEENITVHMRQRRHPDADDESTDSDSEFYETELLNSALTPTELACEFFKKLDVELNRVNKFYKLIEKEYELRAHSLQLQMAILLDLRKNKSLATDDCERVITSRKDDNPEKLVDPWGLPSGRKIAASKEELQLSEKLLRTAFAEFYRQLGLLKSYSAINIMAFSKILKKYDKVTGWNTSLTYLRVVETSYFASSEKVVKLMDGVENIFIVHLTQKNYREAMIYLRPLQQKSFSISSYFQDEQQIYKGTSICMKADDLKLQQQIKPLLRNLNESQSFARPGVFTGCSVAFLGVLALVLFAPSPVDSVDVMGVNTKALLYLSSTMGLILLHLYMYTWNLYLWRRSRINYALIFKWAPGTDIKYQEVLLLSTGLTTLWMFGMIVVKLYPTVPHVDLIPASILVLLLAILFLPLNFCYRSTRFVFLRCMIHVVSSPFCKVVLADFFLADQLTSQVTLIKNFQFLTCYYLGGYYRTQDENACLKGPTIRCLQYVVVLPYWWRLMQCIRRWMDEGDTQQIVNGGKYLSALFSSSMKVAYRQNSGPWLFAYIATSFISSSFGIYWDNVKDWGLMQSKSVNPWLRDHLLLKNKVLYYISMVWANIILRLAWLIALILELAWDLDCSNVDAILAVLEVIRRGHWNFYRLEHEHLQKFGEFLEVSNTKPFQAVEDP